MTKSTAKNNLKCFLDKRLRDKNNFEEIRDRFIFCKEQKVPFRYIELQSKQINIRTPTNYYVLYSPTSIKYLSSSQKQLTYEFETCRTNKQATK